MIYIVIRSYILHNPKVTMYSLNETCCSDSKLSFQTDLQSIRKISPRNEEDKVAAVIVTFCGGATYDALFSSHRQKSEKGTQVSVYSCATYSIAQLLIAFKDNKSQKAIINEMMEDIAKVNKSCVVFNWECCSFYTDEYFYEGPETVMEFVKLVIDRGFMAMFSDFSLKALIRNWDEKYLGPLPFTKLGETQGEVTLTFNCDKLKKSPSAQLQAVGEIAVKGFCKIGTLSSTIVYGCPKQNKCTNEVYTLEILSEIDCKKHQEFLMDDNQVVGHALLRYRSGGCLLTSMGHWIQLMRIDTTEQALFSMIQKSYGMKQSRHMQQKYMSMNDQERKKFMTKTSIMMVSERSPCLSMNYSYSGQTKKN